MQLSICSLKLESAHLNLYLNALVLAVVNCKDILLPIKTCMKD